MEVEWDRGLWGCYVCYADKSHLTDQTNTRTDNDDHIHAHNHHGNASYTLGHNPYSHLTLDEFHARFKLGASRLLLICVFCMHRPPYVQRIHIHSAKKPLPHPPSKHAHTHAGRHAPRLYRRHPHPVAVPSRAVADGEAYDPAFAEQVWRLVIVWGWLYVT